MVQLSLILHPLHLRFAASDRTYKQELIKEFRHPDARGIDLCVVNTGALSAASSHPLLMRPAALRCNVTAALLCFSSCSALFLSATVFDPVTDVCPVFLSVSSLPYQTPRFHRSVCAKKDFQGSSKWNITTRERKQHAEAKPRPPPTKRSAPQQVIEKRMYGKAREMQKRTRRARVSQTKGGYSSVL